MVRKLSERRGRDTLLPQGTPQAFHGLLASLQEEYWAVCRDRQQLQTENKELHQALESASRIGSTNGSRSAAKAATADVKFGTSDEEEEKEEKVEQEVASDAEGLNWPVLSERMDDDGGSRSAALALQGLQHRHAEKKESRSPEVSASELSVHRELSVRSGPYGASELFPSWWNPSAENTPRRGLSAVFSLSQDVPSSFMISPVSRFRLFWDLLAAMILFCETWSVPFQLIYVSEETKLPLMDVFDAIVLGFFSIDIVLNCNTGVLERGKVTLARAKALRTYVGGWFWVDLIATLPFQFVVGRHGKLVSLLRVARLARLLKTLRYLRLFKLNRALQSSADHMVLTSALRWLLMHCVALLGLLFCAHIYTCMWSALRVEQPKAEEFYEAVRLYLAAFSDVYGALCAFRELDLHTTKETIFNMAISVQRVFLVVCFASWVIFTTLLNYESTARLQAKTDHALTYLRRHKLPSSTQIQVLYGLYESGDAKEMQKDFTSLMESNLPTELQRTIIFQLWTPKLLSLGIIRIASAWHTQLVEELALICFEEVFASQSALFKEGDAGFSAYLVLSGEVHVVSEHHHIDIPNYKAGMWLGENALVNPTFRRGFSAITTSLVSVMTVNAEGFWKLLEKLEIDKDFEEWCSKELWRGLCGRCGSVGDHFAHECTGNAPKSALSFSGAGSRRPARELKKYLKKHHLETLFPLLEELGVADLKSLQELDLQTLREHADTHNLNRPFGEMASMLRPARIETFRQSNTLNMKALLETQTKEHFIFISHYKLEAGTEAALMRSELQQALKTENEGRSFSVPVFLDSDNLTTLKDIQERVKKSSNVVVLLTHGVLTRPWVLVEMVTAYHLGITVQLVEVVKPGSSFKFPDNHYYQKLTSGQIMDADSLEVLSLCDVDILEVEVCLREIFKSIAMTYSPHRPDKIRQAEVKALLDRCRSGRPHEQNRPGGLTRPRLPSVLKLQTTSPAAVD